jgi:8-oxo-dGTP diphosphatase
MEQESITLEVTLVLFRYFSRKLQVLTIEKGTLPSSDVQVNESLEDTVIRMCKEIGIDSEYTNQLHTYGDTHRNLEQRKVSVTYIGIVRRGDLNSSNYQARWNTVDFVNDFVLDHSVMLNQGIDFLKEKIKSGTIAQYMLPSSFTLTDLENLYEDILKTDLDKRNFRKRILKLKLVTPTGEMKTGLKHRPASLYKFTEERLVEERMI